MHDFGSLIYLDLHKTGSTYVSAFLNASCSLSRQKEVKHGRIGDDYNPNAFYFISIRHPATLYQSLFQYGLEGRGAVFNRLHKKRKGYLYHPSSEAFNAWLRFVLDPANASYLKEDYQKKPKEYDIGFLSFRYLMLSLAYPLKTLKLYRHTSDPVGAALNASIVSHIIRNERLNDDLRQLAYEIQPNFFDQDKVNSFLKEHPKLNTSHAPHNDCLNIEPEVMSLIKDRERILYQYYETP